ncbi:S8 family serine peptidase [Vibrio ouci]|uniref:ATPase n=1 Tax=Vibrio ouci TaxID=2499078 RepID=A0A4Y8WCN9_9VIBR|nr:ATPase [Vibrio ouci]TFH90128.1 ATPase [Vibrio ouci]
MNNKTILTLLSLLLVPTIGFASSNVAAANNQGFPLIDTRLELADQQSARYFVKYKQGKEQQVRELLLASGLEVVETLDNEQVLVVTGASESVEALNDNPAVEYTEQEPIRKLLSP